LFHDLKVKKRTPIISAEKTANTGATHNLRAPKPFLKWVGGKGQILHELKKSYPKAFNRYFEPFVGGGAVFFDLLPERAAISDANKELVSCYNVVKSKVEELISILKLYKYERELFYSIRDQDPQKLDVVGRAARTIFLNRTGFNGLYRVNSKGKFNVPFGRYKNPTICNEDNLRACSKALKKVSIKSASFEKILDSAKAGDFVYLDPPYIPVSDTSYFTAYQRRGFGMDNQEKLAAVFDELAARNVYVMLSNSDVSWIHHRYRKHRVRVIKARRFVNSDTSRRGPVGEIIVTSC
jgi:DNA adenine methylase